MLRIDNITFSLAGRPLFEQASAVIPEGHKVGIVGRNGTGKTTLFRLITGELAPDDGDIVVPRRARIGGVAQEAPATQDSLLDTVLAADTERASLLAASEIEKDPTRLAEILGRLGDIDAYSAESRAARILSGLGFDASAQAMACADFSGGWRMRVALAAVLFSQPDVLLLDEPTNYLDLEGTMWLEGFLAKYPATVLVISHDRGLLNRAVGAILHLQSRKLTLYQGRYDQFDTERRLRLEEQEATRRKQDAQRAHMQKFVDRFRYKASKAKQAQSRLKMLERLEPIAALSEDAVSAFHLPESSKLSPPIVAMEDATAGYNGAPVISRLNLRIDPDDRIALLGANGQGKSTLSKLIADRLTPLSGSLRRASKLRIGYFAQHQLDELVASETPLQHVMRLRPETAPARLRSMLAQAGIGQDIVDTEVTRLSGGQKARLALMLAVIDAPHLLILDEPTNHLDIESREALVHALSAWEGAVILVSHDPWLISAVADRLWKVGNGRVEPYTGDLEDYRREIVSGEPPTDRGKQAQTRASDPKPQKPKGRGQNTLEAEVAKCEARVSKILEMQERIDGMLANPLLYGENEGARLSELQAKRREIAEGLEKAEALWIKAQEKLDAALSNSTTS